MADIDVKELASEFLKELKNIATGGNSDGKSGQNYGEGKDTAKVDIKVFTDAVDTMAAKLNAFAEQIGINTAALKAIPGTAIGLRSTEDTSKAFLDAASSINKSLGAAVSKLEELRAQAAAGTNVGIGQGDAVRQRAEFQAAGYKDFDSGLKGVTDSAGNFKSSLAGLGYSADDSTRRFNEFSKELSGKQGIQELIKKNIIQPTDVPKLAMLAAQGKTNALDTPESRDKLVQEMVREAQMISQMSIAYGINKQALMDNAIATNESAEAQIRQGAVADDNARRAMRTAQTISIPGGKSLSDLVGKLSSGARLSKEDRAMLSVGTMGMGGQLTSAVKDVQRTRNLGVNDPQRRAAEDRLAGVEAEIRARQISPEGQRLAQSMKEGPQRAALEKMITEGRPAAEAERKIRETTGVGYAESAKIAQERLGAAPIRGEKPDISGAATPTANTGAKVSETLAEINFAYGKNAAAVSGILADLNEKLGDSAKGFQAVKAALTNGVGPGSATETVDQKKARLAPLANTIEAAGAAPGTIADDLLKRLGETQSGGKATGPVTVTSPSTTVNTTGPVNVVPTNPTPAPAALAANPATTVEPPSRLNAEGRLITPTPAAVASPVTRGTGTLGETGFPTEMKDVVAKLHKGETVLTSDQLTNLISGAGMMTASDTASSILSGLTGSKGTNAASGIDMSNIFNFAKTTVSSSSKPEQVTAAKSETNKSSATPASKKTDSIIDKQLAKFGLDATGSTVKTESKLPATGSVQYQNVVDKGPKTAAELAIINAERAASGQQAADIAASKARLTSGLYANPAGSSSSIKQLFDNVSANVGTPGNSAVESGIQRGNIVEKPITSVPITDAMKGYEPLAEETNTAIETEKSESEIDLSETGPSTKDLHDQLIQLNSSIRQLVEHSASGVDIAGAQVKATRSLSGNRFA
jgi:hypothetical protein